MFIITYLLISLIAYFAIKFYHNEKWSDIIANKIIIFISIIVYNFFYLLFFLIKINFTNNSREWRKNKIVSSSLDNKNSLIKFSNKEKLFQNQSGFGINFSLNNKSNLTFNLLNQHHMLVIGTTGIGKTQNIVLPNIILNIFSKDKSNLLIFDPKSELFNLTEKYIDRNVYEVIVLDFINFSRSKWNPFFKLSNLWIDNNLLEFELLLDNIVEMFIVNIKSNKDPIWHNASLVLIKAHIIYILLCNNNMLTPAILINTFSIGIGSLVKQYNAILKDDAIGLEKMNIFKKNVAIFLDNKNKMLPSIYLMTLTSLQKISSANFFNMSNDNEIDLNKKNQKPYIIFINADPLNSVYWPLASLFIFLAINDLIKNFQNKRRTLFILDEFGNLPTIKNFSNIISIARGYNIFFMLIIQSFNQLEVNYIDYNNILSNINYNLFLHTNDMKTATQFSQLLGKTEIIKVNNISNNEIYNFSTVTKPVMDEYDLTILQKNFAILKAAHNNPILIKLLPFYQFSTLLLVNSSYPVMNKLD